MQSVLHTHPRPVTGITMKVVLNVLNNVRPIVRIAHVGVEAVCGDLGRTEDAVRVVRHV